MVHQYVFEFKYNRQVNGKKTEFTVPITVQSKCYEVACAKVGEFVRKNFADRVTEESTIKYVGEFVHGVLKPFVEEVKEEEKMKTYVEMYEEMCGVQKKVEHLEKRVEEFEALQERIDWISADSEKVYENIRFTDMENSRLLIEVSGYKKELSQLNLLMDDMEDRLEKQVVAREGMLKQLREYKAEKKRMNKIIDALTEDK